MILSSSAGSSCPSRQRSALLSGHSPPVHPSTTTDPAPTMAFLRRSKEETIEEEIPVNQEAVAEQTEEEEQQVPRYSQLPDTSFNVMSVRFTARKNANIALFVMLGLVALGILFLGTTYLDTRSSQQEAIEAAEAARIEADRLSAEIAAKVQTGGLGPDKLNELVVQRHSAFLTATQNKLDYG